MLLMERRAIIDSGSRLIFGFLGPNGAGKPTTIKMLTTVLRPTKGTIGIDGVFSGIEIIWDRQFGFLKETLVAPVLRLQIVLGRTLGGATVAFDPKDDRVRDLPLDRLSATRSSLFSDCAVHGDWHRNRVGTFQFGLADDFIVLGALTLLLVAVGSYLFSRIQV